MKKVKFYSVIALVAAVALYLFDFAGNDDKAIREIGKNIISQTVEVQEQDDLSTVNDNGNNQDDRLLNQESPDNIQEQILKRTAYIVSYNKDTKLPNWVAWYLTPERITGPAKRSGVDFEADMDVPYPRAEDSDYYGSGYDRGHMCPAADNKFSNKAMEESFLFTNMCPQNGNLNRGDWNEMEMACRKWAEKYGGVYVVCGPILYNSKHKTIGKNKVVVPEAFFKVVLRMGEAPKAIGFIYKNAEGNRPKGDYVNSVDEVERITGIDFFPSLPDNIEEKIEATADIDDWL